MNCRSAVPVLVAAAQASRRRARRIGGAVHDRVLPAALSVESVSTAAALGDARTAQAEEWAKDMKRRDAEAEVEAQRSLALLEWPTLVAHQAAFTATELGREAVLAGANCTPPSDRVAVELLMDQTTAVEALENRLGIALELGDAKTADARDALTRCGRHAPMSGVALAAVAGMLRVAGCTRAAVDAAAGRPQPPLPSLDAGNDTVASNPTPRLSIPRGSAGELGPLLSILAAVDDLPSVQAVVRKAVDVTTGDVLDDASPTLARARVKLRSVESRLQSTLGRSGGSLVEHAGRWCLAISASGGAPPGGAIAVGASLNGLTLYVEPPGASAANDERLLRLADVAAAEAAVLESLADILRPCVPQATASLAAIVAVDVAASRARLSTWLGGVRPAWTTLPALASEGAPADDSGPPVVQLRRLIHPLLLARQLRQAAVATRTFGGSYVPVGRRLRRLGDDTTDPSAAEAFPIWGSELPGGEPSANATTPNDPLTSPPTPPVGVDVLVRSGVRAVVITGPNTGGKTAALKAMGTAALAARAGLLLAVDAVEADEAPPPVVPLFTRILADLGDPQSLQQSLSTFSGHARRLRVILGAADDASLVLLDEPGAGTDPAEGAALAVATVHHLASTCGLVAITSHFAEAADAARAAGDSWATAAVELDAATLAPTYRLTWGQAGESWAFDVASRFGLDPAVIADARASLIRGDLDSDGGAASGGGLMAHLGTLRDGFVAAAQAAERDRNCATSQAADAANRLTAVGLPAGVARRMATESSIALALAGSQAMLQTGVEAAIQRISMATTLVEIAAAEASLETAIAAADEFFSARGGEVAAEALAAVAISGLPGGWSPAVGDRVRVKHLGGALATVVSSRTGTDTVEVRCGPLALRCPVNDLAPAGPPPTSAEGAEAAKIARLTTRFEPRRGATAAHSGDVRAVPWKRPLAIQTAANTLDLRGMRGEEAGSEIDAAIRARSTIHGGSGVLFIVHGVGSGALRTACASAIAANALVIESTESVDGGATVAYVR